MQQKDLLSILDAILEQTNLTEFLITESDGEGYDLLVISDLTKLDLKIILEIVDSHKNLDVYSGKDGIRISEKEA